MKPRQKQAPNAGKPPGKIPDVQRVKKVAAATFLSKRNAVCGRRFSSVSAWSLCSRTADLQGNFSPEARKTRPGGKAAGYDKSQRACEPSDTSRGFLTVWPPGKLLDGPLSGCRYAACLRTASRSTTRLTPMAMWPSPAMPEMAASIPRLRATEFTCARPRSKKPSSVTFSPAW